MLSLKFRILRSMIWRRYEPMLVPFTIKPRCTKTGEWGIGTPPTGNGCTLEITQARVMPDGGYGAQIGRRRDLEFLENLTMRIPFASNNFYAAFFLKYRAPLLILCRRHPMLAIDHRSIFPHG